MYYIRKHSNGWALTDDATGISRLLRPAEIELAKLEFPELTDEKVLTVFTDKIISIKIDSDPMDDLKTIEKGIEILKKWRDEKR